MQLPLHADQPMNEGFGVVIVTVVIRGGGTILLVDEGDDGTDEKVAPPPPSTSPTSTLFLFLNVAARSLSLPYLPTGGVVALPVPCGQRMASEQPCPQQSESRRARRQPQPRVAQPALRPPHRGRRGRVQRIRRGGPPLGVGRSEGEAEVWVPHMMRPFYLHKAHAKTEGPKIPLLHTAAMYVSCIFGSGIFVLAS
mmetsp:Transcript_3528/g.5807  ORF Transcript_3528/g.5807 Transcript_3528/m.5807 type:complete len:196 (+) Transcript_3528:113-700(+)